MKQKILIWIPFLIIVIGSIIYARAKGTINITGQTMGTSYSVKIVYQGSAPDKQNIKENIDNILVKFNDSLSTYIPNSEISKFNRSKSTDWTKVSKDFVWTAVVSKNIFNKTKSFDPTLGPAINLWGFGEDGEWSKIPSDEKIESLKEYVGYDYIEIDTNNNKIKKLNGSTQVNFSAIAKGYAVDLVSSYLTSIKSSNHLVEIGGEMKSRGKKEDGSEWKVGIETPTSKGSSIEKIIPLNNKAIATSGNYRNYFMKDGVRFSHIINPETLKPINHNLASVTVIHDSAATADAWATALLVLGEKQALELAEAQKLAVFLISGQNDAFKTSFSSEFNKIFGEK